MSVLDDVLGGAVETLAGAGVPSPRYDAAELLAHVLGVTRSALVLGAADPTPEQRRQFAAYVERRAARVPLQHLLGRAAFRHVELAVGPGVFVPRPETEVMAGWVVDRATELVQGLGDGLDDGLDDGLGRAPVVVDLCTGSGAIALSVAHEVPGAVVHAVELDESAHAWALRNLEASGVDLRQGDMATSFPDLDGTVDVVVSNPPYIPLDAYASVAPEVRDHDQALALWSGDDGLDAVRVVEQVAARLLRPGGVVAVEHAEVQAASAPAVFAAGGRWREVRDHLDLSGRARFVTARLAR